MPEALFALSLTLSAVPCLTDCSKLSQLVTDGAVRSAEAQHEFDNPWIIWDGAQELSRKCRQEIMTKDTSMDLLRYRKQMHYVELRYRTFQNIEDAAKVLLILAAATHQNARPNNPPCAIHLELNLLLHEQACHLSVWYYLKLRLLRFLEKYLGDEIDFVLDKMSTAQ